jgi:hypothetical protein
MEPAIVDAPQGTESSGPWCGTTPYETRVMSADWSVVAHDHSVMHAPQGTEHRGTPVAEHVKGGRRGMRGSAGLQKSCHSRQSTSAN